MKRLPLFIAFVFSFTLLQAQSALERLKGAAKQLDTKENRAKMQGALVKWKDKLDSTDFQYAVLVSDNAGFSASKDAKDVLSQVLIGGSLYYKNTKGDAITDEDSARIDLEMGQIAYAARGYNLADKSFRRAQVLFEKENLTGDFAYLKTITSQGLLYATMGRFTQAEEFTVKSFELGKKKFGENGVGMATAYNNYGVLRVNLAQYNEAENDLESTLALLKTNNYTGTMPYAIVLNNKGMLLQTVGRYEEAEKLINEAIAVADKVDAKSRNGVKFQSNLALLYQQMGKYAEAETIYLGMEKKLGKSNIDYATMLGNQAALYMVMGKEDKVEDLLKKAAGIFKSNLGEESPGYAKAVSDLGNFYRYKERYAEAEPLLTKALSVRESTLGKNHPLYVQSQEDIAILSWKTKLWDKAFMTYREVMDKSLEFINTYFPPMSEAEKTKYWDVLSPRFQRFYNFALDAQQQNPKVVEALFDYHIATKALLLNSTNKVKQSILASKDAALIKDYNTWLDQKETLARLYAYSRQELSEQKINLDSIQRATNAMERKLSGRSATFSAGYAVRKIDNGQIRSLLTETEAVVEIVRVRQYTQKFTDEARYVALVMTKGKEQPTLVVLDNGQQLETRYSRYYRNAIQQRIADEYSYDQYWSRIDPALTGKKLVYFSPDGVYSQLNINAFKKTGGDYVLNRYDVVILGNSKDLVAIKQKKARVAKKNATLVGFPDYGAGDIAPLPGTKVELDLVAKSLKAAGYQVTQYMQKTATEANLKAVKGPTLMHIATHGYFLKDVDRGGSAFGVQIESAGDNPLLRSGLMLAGAAATTTGKRAPSLESNDNGILTAYEAMNLNLEGTDLVILSACETGLGDVKAGEGVYGLQRAFLVAGADALIMSLWKVDDAATQQLMTGFYTNWLKLGNKQKAFKQAQLQLMTKYKDPYYWGAFVMMGL
jgi:CHAT domain-containing protein/Flp pilus assembly protein TadD